jgi:hypothetical protein
MEILSVCLLLLADFCLSGRHPAQSGRCSVFRMQTMWGVPYCKRSLPDSRTEKVSSTEQAHENDGLPRAKK